MNTIKFGLVGFVLNHPTFPPPPPPDSMCKKFRLAGRSWQYLLGMRFISLSSDEQHTEEGSGDMPCLVRERAETDTKQPSAKENKQGLEGLEDGGGQG